MGLGNQIAALIFTVTLAATAVAAPPSTMTADEAYQAAVKILLDRDSKLQAEIAMLSAQIAGLKASGQSKPPAAPSAEAETARAQLAQLRDEAKAPGGEKAAAALQALADGESSRALHLLSVKAVTPIDFKQLGAIAAVVSPLDAVKAYDSALKLAPDDAAAKRARDDAAKQDQFLDNGIKAVQSLLASAIERKDRKEEGQRLKTLAIWSLNKGDVAAAQDYGSRAIPVLIETGDKQNLGFVFSTMSQIALAHGDKAVAEDYLRKELVVWQEIGDQQMADNTMSSLAFRLRDRGDLLGALSIFRQTGDRMMQAIMLLDLADEAKKRRDNSARCQYYKQAREADPRLVPEILVKYNCGE